MTALRDRQASCHRQSIPEARRPGKVDFPNAEIATDRPMREYCSKMNPGAKQSEAWIHGVSDRQGCLANKTVDRMAGRRLLWTATPLRPPSGHFGRSQTI